jgi:hypothetical protein
LSAEVSAARLRAGECAVLSWVTWEATEVLLNGAGVIAQDRQEVCPTVTQRYTFVARNGAGQTVREIIVEVLSPEPPISALETSPRIPPTPVPAEPVAPAEAAPTPLAQEPASAQAPTVAPPPAPTVAEAPPSRRGMTLVPVVEAAPIDPAPVLAPAPSLLAPLPQPTATSHPRQPIGENGRPTPTPILVARAQVLEERLDTVGGLAAQDASDAMRRSGGTMMRRGFGVDLLPGYGSFFLACALLVGAGVVVTRRRSG